MATSSYTGAPKTATDFTRLCLGDTDKNAPMFTDEEVAAAVAELVYPTLAAAALADARAAVLSGRVNKSIGKTRLDLGASAENWRKTADRLREGKPGNLPGGDGTGQRTGGIMVGGILRSEKESLRTDTNHEPFEFELGMDDHPGGEGNLNDDDLP